MEIDIKNTKHKVPLGKITRGKYFWYNEKLYIKPNLCEYAQQTLKQYQGSYCHIVVILLEKNLITRLENDNVMVTPVCVPLKICTVE